MSVKKGKVYSLLSRGMIETPVQFKKTVSEIPPEEAAEHIQEFVAYAVDKEMQIREAEKRAAEAETALADERKQCEQLQAKISSLDAQLNNERTARIRAEQQLSLESEDDSVDNEIKTVVYDIKNMLQQDPKEDSQELGLLTSIDKKLDGLMLLENKEQEESAAPEFEFIVQRGTDDRIKSVKARRI